jgi:FlaA1/EpsC-like NDP-sugar epimerase
MKKLFQISRKNKKLILITIDIFFLTLIWVLSFYLRLDNELQLNINLLLLCFLLSLFNCLILFYQNIYNHIARFIDITFLINILKINLLFLFILFLFYFLIFDLSSFYNIPRSILIIYFVMSVIYIILIRVLIRSIYFHLIYNNHKKNDLFIIFDKVNFNMVYDFFSNKSLSREIKFVSIDKKLSNTFIFNKKIKYFSLKETLRLNGQIILDKNFLEKKNYFKLGENLHLNGKNFFLINQDSYNLKTFSEENIVQSNYIDLIKRNENKTPFFLLKKILKNKSILVTGAGGSIGGELCKIISNFKPKKLVMLDVSEASLFKKFFELKNNSNCVQIVGSISNERLIGDILKKYKIDLVYHAAAYKHVGLCETNVFEAIKNNIFGTKTLIKLCVKNRNVKNLTIVSTDKAESPKSLMGATKRIAELLAISKNLNNRITISVVRFGNVLNSSGSVVPIFLRQIKEGGPVTVTDKKATRYFMTIHEASSLILQSNLIKKSNKILILDLGVSINIFNLAKSLINSFAKKNIKIKLIGLRKGEKLHENLYRSKKLLKKTEIENIFSLEENTSHSNFIKKFERFNKIFLKKDKKKNVTKLDERIIRNKLFLLVKN